MYTTLRLVLHTLLLGAASAAPTEDGSFPFDHHIQARHAQYSTNCFSQTGWDGKTYSQTLNKVFGDITELVQGIYGHKLNLPSGELAYIDSKAYQHYFARSDQLQVMRMMQAILYDRNPSHHGVGPMNSTSSNCTENKPANLTFSSYEYDIECGYTANGSDCYLNSTFNPVDAVANKITLCPLWFKPATGPRYDFLNSNTNGTDDNGWCKPGRTFPEFAVKAVSLLSDLTNLNVVGQAAGRSSGTVNVLLDKNSAIVTKGVPQIAEYQAARLLKTMWDDFNADDTKPLPPVRTVDNGYSHAASAVEWYFQRLCGFEEISG